jgi:hypothetical protein
MQSKPVRPLADLIEEAIGPVLAAQGFAAADIVTGWPDLVGEKLASHCEPLKISWPRRMGDAPAEPASLIVRVEGAFALEIQHLVPVLLERINTRFGWKAVGKIVIKQGPVRKESPAAKPLPPSPEAILEAEKRVGPVEDEALREALIRLGAGVFSARSP